jgi:hypothetical protein
MFDKIFKKRQLIRKQELEYISKFNNEWQFKSYQASLNKNNKKLFGGLAIFLSFLLGMTNILGYIAEVFS